jgi:hypothetical protein
MGYNLPPSAIGDNFNFGSVLTPTVGISTVPSDIDLGNITLPSLPINIKYVYVDLVVRSITNTFAGVNYIHPSSNLTASKGGFQSTALTLHDLCLWVYSSSTAPGGIFYGQTDVKDRFVLGEATNIYLNDIACLHDQIILNDVQPVIRLVVG